MSEKIKISFDDINTSSVDEDLKRQEILTRMAQHQQTIAANTTPSQTIRPGGQGGFWRNALVYMAMFGLIASLLGWGLGEGMQHLSDTNPLTQFRDLVVPVLQYAKENDLPDDEFSFMYNKIVSDALKEEKYKNNPYLDKDKDEDEIDSMREKDENLLKWYNRTWYMFIACFIAIGLSTAEDIINRNWNKTMLNFLIGAVLGIAGGLLVSLFIDQIYHFLQGDQSKEINMVRQVFARTVGWGILGLFVAIAPGILMRNWKKGLLGLLGGFIGGALGGVLFDLICRYSGTAIPARFVGIVAFGLMAGIATALLENVAKQGWLKIKAGLIAGKQFILYKNPTTIGSSPKCDVYLFKDQSIAGIHAAIHVQNGAYILCSQTGVLTLVNNQPVTQRKLKNGDTIQIGGTIILFEAKSAKTE